MIILSSKGLCLAGGGIKGAAHIGAIEALTEEGINFDYIAGTSSRKYSGYTICNGIFTKGNARYF